MEEDLQSSTSNTCDNIKSENLSEMGCPNAVKADSSLNNNDALEDDKKTKKKKNTFAQDLKEKFTLLRIKTRDAGSDSKGPDINARLTKEDIILWSKKFDNLISDSRGLERFRSFLQTEFSDENLAFWIACQEYKQLKPSKMRDQANQIFTDFVAIHAFREINLDAHTRISIRDNMSNPNKHTFEEAEHKIQGLMERDSYPRFLQSDVYQKLLKDYS